MQRGMILTAALATLVGLAGPAAAQERPGRYVMQPTDGGIIRMDSDTGAMSLCARRAEQWSCEPIGDAALAEHQELERLKSENAELKSTVKHLEDMLSGSGGRDRDARRAEGPGISIPTEKQVDAAIDYVERMYKKLRDKLRQLDKSGPSEPSTPL